MLKGLKGRNHYCLWCGKIVVPHQVPYGIVWLCVCGRWTIIFRVEGKRIQFQNGSEESALEYIAKIGQILMVK